MRFVKTSLCLILAAMMLVPSMFISTSALPSAGSTEASSTVPYITYMYNFNGNVVQTPHAYIPADVLGGEALGIGKFVAPADIEVDANGNIYVMDTEYIPEGSIAGDYDALAGADGTSGDTASTDTASTATDTAATDTSAADTTAAADTSADTSSGSDSSDNTSSSGENEDDTKNGVVIDESALPEDAHSDIQIKSPEDLIKYIDMLPELSNLTIDYGKRIVVMYDAYNAFSDNQRVKVTNKDKFLEEYKYITVTAEVRATTGAQLDKYLAVLPATDNITIEHEPRIAALKRAYDSLSAAEKGNVSGYGTVFLPAYNKMYYSATIDARTADVLDRFIDLLPPVESITNDYEARVQALLIAYRTLTSDEKPLVTKKDILDAAEYKLDEFQCAERYQKRKGRLVVINPDYTVKYIIQDFDNDGHIDGMNAPGGVTIAPNGDVYIADTENSRVLQFTSDGQFIRDIKNPQISQLGTDYTYRPSKLSVDDSGNIYIIAKNANMGVILLDSNGDFTGFVGAQKVSYNAIDYMWKTILSDEARDRMTSFVPSEYNNIKMDKEGFAYVTTSSIDTKELKAAIESSTQSSEKSPVKRLNPSGKDVLKRWGYFIPAGDVLFDMNSVGDYETSVITDVAVSDHGRYTILDTRFNRLFTYSANGELLYAFGGEGREAGNTTLPSAITYNGDDLLIIDSKTGLITRYEITHYGQLIDQAYSYYDQYEYDESVASWQEVLKENANFDIAYDGIASSFIRTGDYKKAMEYYRFSNNSTGYSNAFNKYRTYVIENYLLVVIAVVIVALFLIVQLFKYFGRRNKAEKYAAKRESVWSQVCYAFYVIIHPFDGFWDLKHEKRGSMKAANIILAAVVVVNIASKFFTAYLFNPYYGYKVSVLREIIMVVFPFLLWVIANWSVTTLLDGEGKMKDIYIFTAYSLTPTVILTILSMVLSHFMIKDEAMYLTFFTSLSTVWCGFLLFSGNTTTHRYTVSKSLASMIVSVIGIGIIVFVLLVIISTYQSMYSFVDNIIKEITYRI